MSSRTSCPAATKPPEPIDAHRGRKAACHSQSTVRGPSRIRWQNRPWLCIEFIVFRPSHMFLLDLPQGLAARDDPKQTCPTRCVPSIRCPVPRSSRQRPSSHRNRTIRGSSSCPGSRSPISARTSWPSSDGACPWTGPSATAPRPCLSKPSSRPRDTPAPSTGRPAGSMSGPPRGVGAMIETMISTSRTSQAPSVQIPRPDRNQDTPQPSAGA